MDSPISVVELETLATAKALEFSIDLGFVSTILEGDSEIVMKALMNDSASLASFGLLIRDVKTYVELFQCISFHMLVKRVIVAHNLARHARYVTGFFVWMKDVPLHNFDVYQIDLSLL